MTRFRLHNLAFHYIGIREVRGEDGKTKKEVWQRQAPAPQEVAALDGTIVNHLLEIIEETWDRAEDRAVHAARFDPEAGARRALFRSHLKELEETVFSQPSDDPASRDRFFEISKRIDDRLYACTTLAASSGLVMMADFSQAGRRKRHLALLKIRHQDKKFTVLQESLTSLGVKDVKMMLTKEILKGIIWPHPSHPGYDLKLVDVQAKDQDRPARYFTESFLGCPAKESDARRATAIQTELVDELAERYQLQKDPDKFDVYVSLLEEKTEATPEEIAIIALDAGVIQGVPREELQTAVSQKLRGRLHEVVHARKLEPELKSLAEQHQWTHVDARREDFRAALDRSMRLDEKKVAGGVVESEILPGIEEEQVHQHLVESGGVDIPREQVIHRKKNQRRTLEYGFTVPREPGSQSFVKITVSGPAVTMQRHLKKQGQKYVFSIEALGPNFTREYR